jgi:hypothetical protein
MNPIDAGTVTRKSTQHIDAVPENVFPLLCPVREGEWLEGWAEQFDMIHSVSGIAEEGCVFRTRSADGTETIWMITRHDRVQKVVEFVRVTTGLSATRLTIAVEPAAGKTSLVHIRYTHTPISRDGAAFLDTGYSEEAFRKSVTWWEDSMNHWLKTGNLLRAAS